MCADHTKMIKQTVEGFLWLLQMPGGLTKLILAPVGLSIPVKDGWLSQRSIHLRDMSRAVIGFSRKVLTLVGNGKTSKPLGRLQVP